MKKDELNEALKIVDAELKKAKISRRDAFKLAGLGGAAFLAGGSELQAATLARASSNAKGKIVIIGGGLAGVSTAALLLRNLSNADITIVEPNPKSVSYQPGTTLVGSGVYTKDDIDYDTKDYYPKEVKVIESKAIDFNPESNKVILENKDILEYDFLVVAAGIALDYGSIKGLENIGDIFSAGDGSKIVNTFGNSGITSVYNIDSSVHMWEESKKFIERAKKGEDLNAIFTAPNTPIKCGGAPKKVMYLLNSRLNEAKVRKSVNMSYYDDGDKLFGVKEYADAIEEQFIKRDFKWNFKHNLTEVDIGKKLAVFDKYWEEQGSYDKDLEEYEMITKNERVEVEFDFLHITPPQKAPDEIGKSAIGSSKSWVPVDKETLQHVKYKNIFALGDIAAVPMGKTGGTVRKQYKVLVDNLISAMEGKELTAKFDGYTVCPLITDLGKVMLAEFNWSGKPTPSFPLDPIQERWIWWLLKVYLLKPMTQYGMLSGRA